LSKIWWAKSQKKQVNRQSKIGPYGGAENVWQFAASGPADLARIILPASGCCDHCSPLGGNDVEV